MADESTNAPVTDSRFVGFNPEVEASHAETATAPTQAATGGGTTAPEAAAAPTPTHQCGMCGNYLTEQMHECSACGAYGHVIKLGALPGA